MAEIAHLHGLMKIIQKQLVVSATFLFQSKNWFVLKLTEKIRK